MFFEARVYIEGVGIYVPNGNEELRVLFPNGERASGQGIRTYKNKPVCNHRAVVQYDARDADVAFEGPERAVKPVHEFDERADRDDRWLTIDFADDWLSFVPSKLIEPRFYEDGGRIAGLPSLSEVLDRARLGAFRNLEPGARPGNEIDESLLEAGLILTAGILSPASDFEGKFQFVRPQTARQRRRNRRDRDPFVTLPSQPATPSRSSEPDRRHGHGRPSRLETYSSVLKVELGQVDSLDLELRPFRNGGEAGDPSRIRFQPRVDTFDVWVRHFCDLNRPNPTGYVKQPGSPVDGDFALNFALQEGLRELTRKNGERLPLPRAAKSWIASGPVGDQTQKCMGSQGGGG